MNGLYLFTDKKAKKVLAIKLIDALEATPGAAALEYRKKLGKDVVAWCHMGGNNPSPDL